MKIALAVAGLDVDFIGIAITKLGSAVEAGILREAKSLLRDCILWVELQSLAKLGGSLFPLVGPEFAVGRGNLPLNLVLAQKLARRHRGKIVGIECYGRVE